MSWPTAAEKREVLLRTAQLDLWRLGHRHVAWWPVRATSKGEPLAPGAVESWCAWCGDYATVEPGAIGRAEARGVSLTTRCEDLKRWSEQVKAKQAATNERRS